MINQDIRQRTIQILFTKMSGFLVGKGQTVDQTRIHAVAIQTEAKIFNSAENDVQKYVQAVKAKIAAMEIKMNQVNAATNPPVSSSTNVIATPLVAAGVLGTPNAQPSEVSNIEATPVITTTISSNNVDSQDTLNTAMKLSTSISSNPATALVTTANLPSTTAVSNADSIKSEMPIVASISNVFNMPDATALSLSNTNILSTKPSTASSENSNKPPIKKLTQQELNLLKSKIAKELSGNWQKTIEDYVNILVKKSTTKDQILVQGLLKIKRIFLDTIEGVKTNSSYVSPTDFDKLFMSYKKCIEHVQTSIQVSKPPERLPTDSMENKLLPKKPSSLQIPSAKTVHTDQQRMNKIQQIFISQYGPSFSKQIADQTEILNEISRLFLPSSLSTSLNSEQVHKKLDEAQNRGDTEKFNSETIDMIFQKISGIKQQNISSTLLFDSAIDSNVEMTDAT